MDTQLWILTSKQVIQYIMLIKVILNSIEGRLINQIITYQFLNSTSPSAILLDCLEFNMRATEILHFVQHLQPLCQCIGSTGVKCIVRWKIWLNVVIVCIEILNLDLSVMKISKPGFLIFSEISTIIFQSTFCEISTLQLIRSDLGKVFVCK